MKYLNFAFIAVLTLAMISCGGNTKKASHIEESESMGMTKNDDDEDIIEDDETEYLEAAMAALDNGNNNLAVEKIMKAVEEMKSYLGEMDDPVHANSAIKTLVEIATKIKGGAKMTSNELEEALLKLEYFSEDDLDIDDDEIEDSDKES